MPAECFVAHAPCDAMMTSKTPWIIFATAIAPRAKWRAETRKDGRDCDDRGHVPAMNQRGCHADPIRVAIATNAFE